MLRIWFDSEDLGRLRVARQPHQLWETVLSLQMLSGRQGGPAFANWRQRTGSRLANNPSYEALRQLRPLIPTAGYFPDFLTPADPNGSFSDAVSAVVRTPRGQVSQELELLASSRSPDQRRDLPTEYNLDKLADALAHYHHTAVGPYAQRLHALVDADRAVRARALLDGGAEALLESLVPMAHWRPPVLEVEYPLDQDLQLGGRGGCCWCRPFSAGTMRSLCWIRACRPRWSTQWSRRRGWTRAFRAARTRSRALAGREHPRGGPTTSGRDRLQHQRVGPPARHLARRGSASQHASVLRRAGLIVSRRAGNTMLHSRTPLGTALLCGS
ncbi:helix-turn-helix domain-containing protein [Fodinicola feengrottensis]|uniref:helix-turn-helix domain-containing protein n=1 Tax=Fodinicola feengrottensis TaxID=435914 RepID=UPI00244276B3|nr:helix-turn-helix domain-containing protein [Fodinicola feengrottensis]